MREHSVCPVVYRVEALGIKFADEEINNGEKVGHEDGVGLYLAAVDAGNGKKKVYACNGGNKSVDGDIGSTVNQCGVFPDGEGGDEGEEKDHGQWPEETNNHNGYE